MEPHGEATKLEALAAATIEHDLFGLHDHVKHLIDFSVVNPGDDSAQLFKRDRKSLSHALASDSAAMSFVCLYKRLKSLY